MAMKPKPQKQAEKQREKKKLSEALRKNLMRRKTSSAKEDKVQST
jgi:hypothetical protein